jgi:chromosome segregation ATPase
LKKTESELRNTVTQLEIKLSMSTAAEAELTAQKDGELATLRSRVESLGAQVTQTKERCSQLEKESQAAASEAQEAQARYSNEILSHTNAVEELNKVKSELSDAVAKLAKLESEMKSLEETSKLEKEALEAKATSLESQIRTYDDKVSEVSRVNDILQDQLQELGVKVSVLDTSGVMIYFILKNYNFVKLGFNITFSAGLNLC